MMTQRIAEMAIGGIMKIRKTPTKFIVTAVALLLVGITISAVTRRDSPAVTRVRVCVKDNGQLRMLTGSNTACDPSEQPMEWMVGGELTGIQIGPGLIGRREDGIVNLALDPSILQTCAGCGRIFAGFDDGPRDMPRFVFGEELPQIAKLELPAGNYAVFAKLVVSAKEFEGPPITRKEFALCKLTAGSDFDNSNALLEVEDDRPTIGSINDGVVLTLEVVHRFAEPGEAVLRCSKGPFSGDGQMELRNLKIIAIEAASISNVFLGEN